MVFVPRHACGLPRSRKIRLTQIGYDCARCESISTFSVTPAEPGHTLAICDSPLEEICIDKGALVLDIATDEVYFSADDFAYKNAYVAVFQAWAKGLIKGTAEQVFDATKSVLED